MRLIGIGGEPTTGKTTLMRSLMAALPGKWRDFSYGLLRGHWNDQAKVVILGIYDDSTFAGTDRLSMAVQQSFEMFLVSVGSGSKMDDVTVLFEGDRLFNGKSIRRAKDLTDAFFIVLAASAEEKAKRHRLRGDHQTEKFQRSRKTKYDSLCQEFPFIERMVSEQPTDLGAVQERVLHLIRTAQAPGGESPLLSSSRPGAPAS